MLLEVLGAHDGDLDLHVQSPDDLVAQLATVGSGSPSGATQQLQRKTNISRSEYWIIDNYNRMI